MAIVLGPHQYGKAETRLVRVVRTGERHELVDLTVSTALRGHFDAAHLEGDQHNVLPTDTQKNTAYVWAKRFVPDPIESWALSLARHFVDDVEPVTGARVEVERLGWARGGRRRPAPSYLPPHRARGAHGGGDGRRRGRARRAGVQGPRDPEVDRIRLPRLPRGRADDPAADRRPHHGHLADGPLATLGAGRGHRLERAARVGAGGAGRALREPRVARAAADALAHGEGSARGPSGDRGDPARGPEQAPLRRRSRPVRRGEPERGLPRGRPAVRAHPRQRVRDDAPPAGDAWLPFTGLA